MYTNLHTKIFTLKHGKFEKSLTDSGGTMTSLQHLTSIILLWNDWKLENFGKIQTFLGLKWQKIVRMHKTCLTSQFLRLSLARFSREMAYLPPKISSDHFTQLPATLLGENYTEIRAKFEKFFNISLKFSPWLCVVQVTWLNFKQFSYLTDDNKISLTFRSWKNFKSLPRVCQQDLVFV